MNFSVMLIIRILAASNLSLPDRQTITTCTLYGTRASDRIDMEKRFQKCVTRRNKQYVYDSRALRIFKIKK